MPTDRLSLYNGALRHIGSRELASLTENRESRRVLDGVWSASLIRSLLEAGLWNFATRTVMLEYTGSIAPGFGYQRAYQQPEDFVRTVAVGSEGTFNNPLLQYADENGYWYADLDNVFVKYVSDADDYGSDLSRWPESFTQWAEVFIAWKVAKRLTGSDNTAMDMLAIQQKLLVTAKSRDAMADATVFLPPGSWATSRGSRMNGRRDLGNRGRLIG
jgi:hypothetical protein